MNNFRPHHAKPLLGSRDLQQTSEFPNPWMTEDELTNMRRQTSQRHSFMPNMPNMQPPHLNQTHMLSMQNKNYINESSCKMTGSNFTRIPNPSIFKSVPSFNEPSYQNRLSDRFSYSNSFSNVNMQYKNNEGSLYKDIPPPNMMNLQSHRNQSGVAENISRPLYPNMRQPQERFSCMQNNESHFHPKLDNSQIYEGKGFPAVTDKSMLMQSSTFNDKVSNSLPNNFPPYKQNFKATTSLFPAYAPKDTIQESSKIGQSPSCTSDFSGKSNNFCDKTEFSNRYSSALQQFKASTDSYPVTSTTEINDLFTQPSNSTSHLYEKQPFKAMPKPQTTQDSFKPNAETINSSSQAKFSFSPENQQSCFQNSNEMSFQKSPNLQIPDLPPSTVSKDCLMQNTQFSSQSDTENLKSFSSSNSFNFETSLNVSDIAELLPGFDAILKETLNKSDDMSKTDLNKSNSAFDDDDDWSKHSIPFIGDNNQVSFTENNNNNNNSKDFNDIGAEFVKRKSEECEFKSKEINIANIPDTSEADNELMKGVQKDTLVGDVPKVHSALEEAIELLVKGDAIVGLDYLIEYKKNICQKDSFPFRCKLCNSAITRPSIIDHILGTKHRMRYLKTKDESKYDYIVSLKVEKAEKDEKIAESALELERLYGRGHVVVNVDDFQRDSTTTDNSFSKDEEPVETIITLDKIPIGFEALSPQHDDTSSANFDLEPSLNQANRASIQNHDNTNSPDTKHDNKISHSEFSLPTTSTDMSPDCMTKSSLPQSDNDSCSQENSKLCVELNIKQIEENAESSNLEKKLDSGAVKRSASPDPSSSSKLQKLDKPDDEITDEKKTFDIKKEPEVPAEKKIFNPDLFDELSKCTISSEEEASIALQAINILMEIYMRYKLQHVPLELVETLMKALQGKSPDKMEEIVGLLNNSKISNIDDKFPEVGNLMELDMLQKEKSNEEQQLADPAKNEMKIQEFNFSTSTVTNSISTAISVSNTDSISLHNAVSNDTFTVSASMPTTSATFDNVYSASINDPTKLADSTILPNAMNTQGINPVCLKPPPFFKWPQTSEASPMVNQVSYANVQGSQNIMWTTAYQQPQLQYGQLPYYQAQTFGSTFTGTQAYTQFPVLAQNSVQINMAAPPPLPPPLPPPPPVPSDAHQSHYPTSSTTVPNQSVSQSAPLLGNSPYVSSFSKPPPPPPPPLP